MSALILYCATSTFMDTRNMLSFLMSHFDVLLFLQFWYDRRGRPMDKTTPNPIVCLLHKMETSGISRLTVCLFCRLLGLPMSVSIDYHSQPKCVNCAGAHSASSKECPKWVSEKKVQAVKAEFFQPVRSSHQRIKLSHLQEVNPWPL